MGLIKEKPGVGIAIAVVAIAIAGFIVIGGSGSGVEPGSRFYYDLATGDLVPFKAPDGQKPPLALPNGNQGVIAHVYACGDCSQEQFLGYLEKYTDQYKEQAAQEVGSGGPGGPAGDPVTPGQGGQLVAAQPAGGGEPQWAPMISPQGSQIIQAARGKCGDAGPRSKSRPVECLPE